MATTPRPKPYVWVTWLSAVLSGTTQCRWSSWYKAHFKYDKRPTGFDLTAWGADHDRMVRAKVEALEADGYKVSLEKQNSFHLHGKTAILGGKPDVTAKKAKEPLLIWDGKTGDQSAKDWWQMLIYLTAIPMAWQRADLWLRGELGYKEGTVVVQPEELTADRRDEMFSMLRMLGGDQPPPRTPNVSDCQFCDIPDCPDRLSPDAPAVLTEEF